MKNSTDRTPYLRTGQRETYKQQLWVAISLSCDPRLPCYYPYYDRHIVLIPEIFPLFPSQIALEVNAFLTTKMLLNNITYFPKSLQRRSHQ